MIRPQLARQGSLWLLLAVALILLAACGGEKGADAPFVAQRSDASARSAPAAPGSPLNLITQQASPYRVSYAALRQAGLVSDPAQLNTLGLTNLGQPVPVWVDGEGADAETDLPGPSRGQRLHPAKRLPITSGSGTPAPISFGRPRHPSRRLSTVHRPSPSGREQPLHPPARKRRQLVLDSTAPRPTPNPPPPSV